MQSISAPIGKKDLPTGAQVSKHAFFVGYAAFVEQLRLAAERPTASKRALARAYPPPVDRTPISDLSDSSGVDWLDFSNPGLPVVEDGSSDASWRDEVPFRDEEAVEIRRDRTHALLDPHEVERAARRTKVEDTRRPGASAKAIALVKKLRNGETKPARLDINDSTDPGVPTYTGFASNAQEAGLGLFRDKAEKDLVLESVEKRTIHRKTASRRLASDKGLERRDEDVRALGNYSTTRRPRRKAYGMFKTPMLGGSGRYNSKSSEPLGQRRQRKRRRLQIDNHDKDHGIRMNSSLSPQGTKEMAKPYTKTASDQPSSSSSGGETHVTRCRPVKRDAGKRAQSKYEIAVAARREQRRVTQAAAEVAGLNGREEDKPPSARTRLQQKGFPKTLEEEQEDDKDQPTKIRRSERLQRRRLQEST